MIRTLIVAILTALTIGCNKNDNFNNEQITYSISASSNTNITDKPLLIQAYPNPFSSRVNVDLVVNQQSEISVSVSGKRGFLQKIIDKYETGPGYVNIRMDFTDFEPGVYLCEIVVNDIVERIELLKAM